MPIAIPAGSDRLPAGRHEATEAEVEATFVNGFGSSTTRRPLFERWRLVTQAMERLVAVQTQWVDGSYVTTKDDPRDIDVVSHFKGDDLDQLDDVAKTLLEGLVAGHTSRDLHSCDSYLIVEYPNGHLARPAYEATLRYWDQLFGTHRDGDPKGYVEVRRSA